MSLQIKDTKATITKVEDKGKFSKCTVRTAEKDLNGEWQSMFWNAMLVGEAKNVELGEKAKVNIVSGKVKNRQYEGKTYTDLVIFKLDVLEAEKKEEFIPVELDDELPF